MSDKPTLLFSVPTLDLSFRVGLLPQENPDVVEAVLNQMPLKSVLGHVVISGETIWLPTRIVHLGRNNMVQRHLGAVYLYAPGQTICLCYGKITESANINKFAEVYEEDLPILQRLGEQVYEQTVAQPRRNIVGIDIREQI